MIDFGFSSHGNPLGTYVGHTKFYVAPEVLAARLSGKEYDLEKADVYSAGKMYKFFFVGGEVSDQSMSLIESMTNEDDPSQRPTFAEVKKRLEEFSVHATDNAIAEMIQELQAKKQQHLKDYFL